MLDIKTELFKITYAQVLDHKRKMQARKLVTKAVLNGDINPFSRCQICEKEKKTEAHHVDYGLPLEVIWLCKQCHGKVHCKDHPLNPINNRQTDLGYEIEETDMISVAFTLPIRNFLAMKEQCEQRNLSISTRMRELVISQIPVIENQLFFNFGVVDDDTRNATNKRVQMLGEAETNLLQRKVVGV
jgi:hypothetical protein